MIKNNGRPFEKLVAIIQEAYKDLPQTKIYTNHKVRDRLGKKREFDVFINTNTNNFDFNVAIECKDYQKPVSVSVIEAFNSKCSTVNNINKKIIVSSKGFQFGAVDNAKLFDIELRTLSSINKENIVLNPKIQEGFMSMRLSVIDYRLHIDSSIFGNIIFSMSDLHKLNHTFLLNNNSTNPGALIQKQLNTTIIQQEILTYMIKESMKNKTSIYGDNFLTEMGFDFEPIQDNVQSLIINGRAFAVTKIQAKIRFESQTKSKKDANVSFYLGENLSKDGELCSISFEGQIHPSYFYISTKGDKEEHTLISDNKTTKLNRTWTIYLDE
ncbi:restriction endonuclease [Spirosoma agri]|uniref:Restriction endonuclease type IV Mrr domain-containing protein n=1 Tax=Spirosoma agri TaxID=1987381 RepID=A0A6M0IHR8_9BACT|nr:restriction endonuclease [Spirosoma agri]NEU67768.1 hypothetical protein [Spirosoma agri]